MKQETKTRIKSAALALMMVVASVPVTKASPVVVAYAADAPKISFDENPSSDSAYVITSSFVDVKETYASGTYVPSGLSVYDDSGIVIDKDTPGSGVTFAPSERPYVNTIFFPEDFNPTDAKGGQDPSEPVEKTFNIRGHYYTIVPNGTVTERVNKDGETVSYDGDVKTANGKNEAIMKYSRMTLKCNIEETAGRLPHFIIDPDADDPEGIFDVFKEPGTEVTVRECTKNGDIKGTVTKTLVIRVYNSKRDITFTLNPKDTTTTTIPATATEPEKKIEDNYIRKGTTFELIYTMPESNPLYLTVMTPQAAMNRIEQQIQNCTGVGNSKSFINLKGNNTLDYIDQDFELRYISTQFGKNFVFRVDWKWEAKQIRGDDGNFRDFKDDDEKAKAQALLNPPNSNNNTGNDDWQPAGLPNNDSKRMVDDVKGELTATVSYQVSGSNYLETSTNKKKVGTNWVIDTTKTLPVREIIIKGTGVSPSVTGTSRSTGQRYSETPKTENNLNKEFPAKVTNPLTMDAYQGGIPQYNAEAKGPFLYEISLGMGAKNSASPYATVEVTGDVTAISLEKDDSDGKGYQSLPIGTSSFQINNNDYSPTGNNTKQGYGGLKITALNSEEERHSVTITIQYYKKGPNNTVEPNTNAKYVIRIDPTDSTPSQDTRLRSLEILDQDGKPIKPSQGSYNFNPETRRYVIHVPYKTSAIKLNPWLLNERGAGNPIRITMRDSLNNEIAIPGQTKDSGPGYGYRIPHHSNSFLIPFYKDDSAKDTSMVGTFYTIEIATPCQDPRPEFWTPPYVLEIMRDQPSTDKTLGSLGIWVGKDGLNVERPPAADNLIKNFDSTDEDKNTYDIWIPYSTQRLLVRPALGADSAAELSEMTVAGLPDYKLEPQVQNSNGEREWLHDVKEHFAQLPKEYNGVMELHFVVTSEKGTVTHDETEKNTYVVRIHREAAKDDAYLSEFKVFTGEIAGKPVQVETELAYEPAFSPDTKIYTLNVPYSVTKIKFQVTANDPNISAAELWEFNTAFNSHNGTKLLELGSSDAAKVLQLGVPSSGVAVRDVTDDDVLNRYGGFHPFYLYISPESEKPEKTQEYLLRVRRAEPSHDAKLKDLTLQGQDNTEIKTFAFHPDKDEYHITVPYGTTGISFTANTNHEFATMEIRQELLGGVMSGGIFGGDELKNGQQSQVYDLKDKPEEEKQFWIVVTAEDGNPARLGKKPTTKTYKIFIQREKPSDDARLKALKTENTGNFKPLFISSKTDYTADVNEGAPGVIIIPTANHPNATIRVDGVVVESGTPTDLIELLEVKQTVRIEVIAEDGVTRKVYKIEFTNQNLIEKTSNADLKRLSVNYGLMTPNFQAAVTEYEVTAKEKVWSVDVIPRVADQYATMRVLNGTRELGDYNGNYALALVDGENKVTVEVTSPDKTVKKNYEVTIYRNEEEKLKNLTPLEAEDINFEQVGNPIIVKIEEYPRVGASVFNTLREEYPDRSIIFQGNDYSIRFDAKNLTRVIPQTEIYDFRMTFDSPDEEAIYDLIGSRSANDDIIDDVVMLYFDYHGSLPGPATFSLSLGRRYANDTLYWHYYNQERDRIDYYGSLQSNSKGNVAVSIDHFSTYIVSPEHRIAGSEDKDGIIDELGMVSNGKDLLGSGGKLNPDTGAKEAP